jgi:hypothetical protein
LNELRLFLAELAQNQKTIGAFQQKQQLSLKKDGIK